MSTVRGFGRYLGSIGGTGQLFGASGVFPSDATPLIIADWFFPAGPPAPVKIPYTWLSPPLRYKPDKPLTTADVSVSGGSTARQTDRTSIAEYGNNKFTATLATANPGDANNLAIWVLDYYATQPGQVPRARMPELVLKLAGRSMAEMHRIMSVTVGQRIEITDSPGKWPAGMAHQIVEGVKHVRGEDAQVIFNTSPVVGVTPGVAGPWFYAGTSNTSSSDVAPY